MKYDKQKKEQVTVGVLLAVFAVAELIALIAAACREAQIAARYIASVSVVAVACFGAVYLFTGAKKKTGGKLLKAYFILSALSTLGLLGLPSVAENKLSVIACLVWLGGYAILAMAKDLGEKKSKTIALVIIGVQVIQILCWLFGDKFAAFECIDKLSRFVISLSLYVLISAKYADKKSRGRQ